MKERARQGLVVTVSAMVVASGIWLGGSERDPANLFLVWFLPVAVVQAVRGRRDVIGFLSLVVVLAASIVGLVHTLGGHRVATPGGGLVCAGLAAAVLAAAGIAPIAQGRKGPVATADPRLHQPAAGAAAEPE